MLKIARGTTDPRVEFISQVLTQILIKFQFQNLDLALTSKSLPNIRFKIQLSNVNQKSAAKYQPNLSFKIKPPAQNLNKSLAL